MERVPIGEAARRLGISVPAVRARIRRGSLIAKKDAAGRWLVRIPDDIRAQDGVQSSVADDDRDDSRRMSDLREEVAYLRERLAARDDELREMRVLVQTAQQTTQRLLPPVATEAARHGEDESPRLVADAPPEGTQRDSRGLWARILAALRG